MEESSIRPDTSYTSVIYYKWIWLSLYTAQNTLAQLGIQNIHTLECMVNSQQDSAMVHHPVSLIETPIEWISFFISSSRKAPYSNELGDI